jgi:hypothetical protein
MRFSGVFLVVAAGLALTACKTGGDQSQAAATPQAKTASAAMICHDDPDTGTRISAKECHTQAQWDAMAAESRDSSQGARGPQGASAAGK